MSRVASIAVKFHQSLPALENLAALFHGGWGFGGFNTISYIPLGVNRRDDWGDAPVENWPAIQSELAEKAQKGELIGIFLIWQDEFGASFVFEPDGEITVHLDG